MLRYFVPRAVGALFLLSLLGACGSGETPTPPPTPTVTMSLGAAAGSVAAGSSTTVTATITRGGGFTGPVTIAATGAPAGVTVSGGTIAAGATTQVVSIASTTGATTGLATLNITGTATGVTITPASYALTVTAAPAVPGVTLLLASPSATLTAGGTTTITANITRTGGFTGAVTVAATGAPTGVTITGGTIAIGATSLPMTVTASPAATLGTGTVSITGAATGLTIAPDTLALTVTAPVAGQIGDLIGGEVAGDQASAVALSANGTRVVIGALFNDGNGTNSGHARVYERTGSTWTQMGSDLDGEVAEDRFGGAVAMNDAGSRIIVGSYLNDGGGSNSGSARVFDWSGTAWVQVGADIDGTVSAQSGRGSGWAVGMSASGHRVITGGPGVGSGSGEVAVYELTGGAWVLVGARIAGTLELGYAVAISDNGNRIALSQPSGSSNGPGTVTVYDWSGSAWTPVGSPIAGEAADDTAGSALSMSGDGSMLAIGAPSNGTTGQVRVYRLTAGVWTQVGVDLDGPTGTAFGTAVSLSADGTRLLASAPNPSTIRLYTLSGSTWTLATTPVYTADRRAGSHVALSANGLVAAVGAEYGDPVAGNAAGTVRVYNLPAP